MSLRLEFLDFATGQTQTLEPVPPGSVGIFEDIGEKHSTIFIIACLQRARGGVCGQIYTSFDETFLHTIPSGGLNQSNLLQVIEPFGKWQEVVTTTDHETGLLLATHLPDTNQLVPTQPIHT